MAAYNADQTISTVDDYYNGDFYRIFMSQEPASEEDVAKRVETQNKLLTLLTAQLGEAKFFGGDKPSIADFYVFAFLSSFAFNSNGNPAQKAIYEALRESMSAHAAISNYATTMGNEL